MKGKRFFRGESCRVVASFTTHGAVNYWQPFLFAWRKSRRKPITHFHHLPNRATPRRLPLYTETMKNMIAVGRVGRLFGDIDSGGVAITLYDTLPEEFDPTTDPLFVEIDSLPVPLYCESFATRGRAGANVRFADFDSKRRAEELVGKELFIPDTEEEDDDDEFYMEDLIGFSVSVGKLRGKVTDYYDSEMNPLLGIDFGQGERLVPAAEEFIAAIDFERQMIRMVLPEGLLEL